MSAAGMMMPLLVVLLISAMGIESKVRMDKMTKFTSNVPLPVCWNKRYECFQEWSPVPLIMFAHKNMVV